MAAPGGAADRAEIENLVAESHYLIDSGRWSELGDSIFALEEDGVVPEADFGFACWRGRDGILAGFDGAMPRFEAAFHVYGNLHIAVDGDSAVARYYMQGWHWVLPASGVASGEARPADFLVLGVMTDQLVRQRVGWRVRHRRLLRAGPGVAVGSLPPFLDGLGE
jgi:hypothetical protein